MSESTCSSLSDTYHNVLCFAAADCIRSANVIHIFHARLHHVLDSFSNIIFQNTVCFLLILPFYLKQTLHAKEQVGMRRKSFHHAKEVIIHIVTIVVMVQVCQLIQNSCYLPKIQKVHDLQRSIPIYPLLLGNNQPTPVLGGC